MIEDYLHQSATWKQANGLDKYGKPTFVEQSIKVRWDMQRKLVRSATGDQVVSEGTLFCLEPVKADDRINDGSRDWNVITVSDIVDLDGNIAYREVSI